MRCFKISCSLVCLVVLTTYGEELKQREATKYLAKFGYLSVGRSGHHNVRTAIKRFQKFFHLKQTGELDAVTIFEMEKPRCGVADVDLVGNRVKRYKTGPKWFKTDLTYRFENYGKDLPTSNVKSIIQKAFDYWSAETPLTFTETSSIYSDFTIKFAAKSHGDSSPFDGPRGVLAHAYFPADGRIHFDEDERFTETDDGGIHLLSVAVHEIGHAIGLHHSDVRGSIMWPSYNGYDSNLKLHNDDIAGIRSLYDVCEDSASYGCLLYKVFPCSKWAKANCRNTCNMC